MPRTSTVMPGPPTCRCWSISGRPGAGRAGPWRLFSKTPHANRPRLRVAKVDTDAEPDLAARYRIQAIPTMILMRGGREIARHSGVMSVGKLRDWVEQNLQS